MNDSPYGLTASVWTNAEKNPESEAAFLALVDELETGTVYLNRLASAFALTRFTRADATMLQGGLRRPCTRVDRREEQRTRDYVQQIR